MIKKRALNNPLIISKRVVRMTEPIVVALFIWRHSVSFSFIAGRVTLPTCVLIFCVIYWVYGMANYWDWLETKE